MKTILVPIDFSKVSENAFNYAIEMARVSGAKLVLVHVTEREAESDAMKRNEIETSLLNMCLIIAHKAKTESSFVYKTGNIFEKIEEAAKEKKADLIIMGTHTQKDFSNMLFGSHTIKTMVKVQAPVLIIPENVTFKAPRTITYATNYKVSDIGAIRFLADLVKPFNSQINLLHISPEATEPEKEKQEMETFMSSVTENVDYNNLSFQITSAAYISDRLKEYICSGAADMLVMSTHLENNWQRLFEPSMTEDMAGDLCVPLLCFHHQVHASVKLFS